jgi:hypothetical protein
MKLQQTAASETVSLVDLRALAAAKGPCITVAVTIPNPVQIRTHLKNAIREVERALSPLDIDPFTTSVLLEPIHALAASIETEGDWAISVFLARSPEIFHYFLLRESLREFVTVGDRFQVRPLLSWLTRDQRFYVLALSQKHVRLLRCTDHSVEEVPLHGRVPQNLHVWVSSRQPDHVLNNRAFGGPSVGSMRGVVFGTSTDRERQDQYLTHFFKEVDKGLHNILADETAPLVLAGVEYETALYRTVNTNSRLIEYAVQGSPDGLSAVELHDRALEIVKRTFAVPLRKVINQFEKYRGSNRVSFNLTEILTNAHAGRISGLLLREDAERRGIWNDATSEEDLLNLAAVQTLSHRGQAFALKGCALLDGKDAAAILRF